jgi:hypothetical protein
MEVNYNKNEEIARNGEWVWVGSRMAVEGKDHVSKRK